MALVNDCANPCTRSTSSCKAVRGARQIISERLRPTPMFALSPALLVALALRLAHLGQESLWYDETVSAYMAAQSLPDMITHTALDIHPPGYYALLHLWGGVAGTSEYSLAFFSLFFGVLLVPLTYRLSRSCAFPRHTSVLAAWLSALSSYSVWYSQEVRMYTLAACLAEALLLATVRLVRCPKDARGAMLWAVLASLNVYVLYFSGLLVAFLSAFWFLCIWSRSRNRLAELRTWLGVNVGALLLYIPWLPIAVRQAIDPPVPPWRSVQPLAQMLRDGALALLGGQATPTCLWPIGILALIWACATPLLSRDKKPLSWILIATFMLPWGIILLVSTRVPLFHPRYLFPFAPAFLIILSASVDTRLADRCRLQLVALLLLAFSAINGLSQWRAWHAPQYRPDDLRSAVHRLSAMWCPGDAVLVNAGYAYVALAYYWHGEFEWLGRLTQYSGQASHDSPIVLIGGSIDGAASLGWGSEKADFYSVSYDAAITQLSAVMRQHNRLWVLRLYDTVTDPQGQLRHWLSTNLINTEDYLIPGPSYGRLQAFVAPARELPCSFPTSWGHRLSVCTQVGQPNSQGVLPITLHVAATQLGNSIEAAPVHYTLRARSVDSSIQVQSDGPVGGTAPAVRQSLAAGAVVRQPVALHLPSQPTNLTYEVLLGFYTLAGGNLENLMPTTDTVAGSLAVVGGAVW